eukprot:4478274-Lingulodinium_polyedra.AAC.1
MFLFRQTDGAGCLVKVVVLNESQGAVRALPCHWPGSPHLLGREHQGRHEMRAVDVGGVGRAPVE